ncbi:C4-dicarboxylate TRAP transporter substrate-binding protein [Sulfitobacter sp. F26169L]|uniref:C4-dicarboxylate TRAP transporter substrate-binding protein n=1 Tax=Sulfitobacter sp. F26169L TaxID=2996015 RepID=UPI002260A774|nr:C4-dicarboxylate TRAP transporter substrate-binding protein [Sulfitobacter sp. F26169L]MCX7568100.1 C4-dicarboxylate TRAP transporter substrate-binding protein [Sulfitobacter sp. F26169L]
MKHMKKTALAAVLATGFATAAVAETVLIYTEGGPNRGTRAAALQGFADNVKEISDGDLAIDIHWGGALMKLTATLGGVRDGAADMGTVLSAYEPKRLMAFGIGDLPLASSDPWVGMRAMYELMTTNQEMIDSFAAENVVYISNYTSTGVNLNCTGDHRIETIEDIKGKKIRVGGTYAKVLNDLGANTITMGYNEVYQALDSGLVDCEAGYLYTLEGYKLYEVLNHTALANWGQLTGFGIAMNKDVYDGLSQEQQQVLAKAGDQLVDDFARAQIEQMSVIVDGLRSGDIGRKVEVVEFQDRDKLLEASAKYRNEWAGEVSKLGIDGDGLWSAYTALIAKYENELETKGYPWNR